MNNDRGMIKWMPFKSLPQDEVLKKILKEKERIAKPILSKEQLEELEKRLVEAFYEQIDMTLTIYSGGFIKKITSRVIKLNSSHRTILLQNHVTVHFNQILDIDLF